MGDESKSKTLYAGNLPSAVTEGFLNTIFGDIKEFKQIKFINKPGDNLYAFLEFETPAMAATALDVMNKHVLMSRSMRVGWATSGRDQTYNDTEHHHIFVGDLSQRVNVRMLRNAFEPFGEISNCRIVRDIATKRSKGYAFVSFVNEADAVDAIDTMNGQMLESRFIRTNWSSRSPLHSLQRRVSYHQVHEETTRTVYIGGFPSNVLTSDTIQSLFGKFGSMENCKVFQEQGFALVRFVHKTDAANMIFETNGTMVHGTVVKCHWSIETDAGDVQAYNGPPTRNYYQYPNPYYNMQYPANCSGCLSNSTSNSPQPSTSGINIQPGSSLVPQPVQNATSQAFFPGGINTQPGSSLVPQPVQYATSQAFFPGGINTQPGSSLVPQPFQNATSQAFFPGGINTQPGSSFVPQPVQYATSRAFFPGGINTQPGSSFVPQPVQYATSRAFFPGGINTQPGSSLVPQPVQNATSQVVPIIATMPQTY